MWPSQNVWTLKYLSLFVARNNFFTLLILIFLVFIELSKYLFRIVQCTIYIFCRLIWNCNEKNVIVLAFEFQSYQDDSDSSLSCFFVSSLLRFLLYEKDPGKISKPNLAHFTEVRFVSFLSGGFTTSKKSTGKEIGKPHLCAFVENV